MKLSVLAVALAAVAELPAPALADRPTRSPVPLGTVTVTDVCEFPVLIEEIVNREKAATFADGRQIVTGTLKVRATDTETGTSRMLNISGPVHVSPDGSTFTFFGRSLIVLTAAQTGGTASLTLTTGRTTLVYNADGTVTVVPSRGGSTDLCAALGG